MKLFLCGGGAGLQVQSAYYKFNSIINHNKPLLYIPLAMKDDNYDSCYEWITNELKFMNINIFMVRSFEELLSLDFDNYCAIFIGGGNTFDLLYGLKDSGCFNKIKDYILNDGIVFGGSAGAIIFGYDLDACKLDDSNEIGLVDQCGFNVLDNISILCHFTNRDSIHDKNNNDYLLGISDGRKLLALPEEDTLFINGNDIEVIGSKDFYLFFNNKRIKINPYNFTDNYKKLILKKKIKNIVFDLGSVILKGVPKDFLLDKNIDSNMILKLNNYFDKISICDYGKESLEDVFNSCCFDEDIINNYKDYLVNYFKYRDINMDLVKLINILKNNNYKIFILSDNNKEAYNYYKELEILKNIDGWTISCFYNCLKKDEKLFDIFLNKYNLDSRECYFIDDNSINIDIAAKKGFNTFLFNENNDINILLLDMYNHGVGEIYER